MSSNWSKKSRRQGMTLVEVVTGIALLATLLVTTLTAFRLHAAQIRGAQERMEAIRAVDGLLTVWFAGASLPQLGQQGELPGYPQWMWRVVPGPSVNQLTLPGAAVVQLEVLEKRNAVGGRVLTAVELLVPAQDDETP